MIRWHLGEDRYFYTTVTSASGDPFTISSASYIVYDTSDDSIVTSGGASVSEHIIYTQWEPTEAGRYVGHFSYDIDSETFSSRQVIEIVETI